MAKSYMVKEIFYTLQGEGLRAGTPSVFLRFAGCNVGCTKAVQGFDCDTDWLNGEAMTLKQIVERVTHLASSKNAHDPCPWVVFTGGEPGLQIDHDLISELHLQGFLLAVESNGTVPLPEGLDWICVSPKLPDEMTLQRTADEVKFVVAAGATIPETTIEADHYLISPAWEPVSKQPLNPGPISDSNLTWCIQLVLENPGWSLSVQQHKQWGVL